MHAKGASASVVRRELVSVRGLFLGGILAAAVAFSGLQSLAETTPPNRLALEDVTLVLNGHGTREKLWTDIYECALYLPRASANLRYIQDPATPKAVRITVMYDDIPNRMPDEWREMFRAELSGESFARLRDAYGRLREGDVLLVTYAPDQGTKISVNDVQVVADRGNGLIDALLQQLLGDDAKSDDLRRLLLNYRGRAA